jgi:hypothetical protein
LVWELDKPNGPKEKKMENTELDNVASELTPSDNTQTADQTAEKEAPQETTPVTTDNVEKVKPSRRYETLQKSYDELRSFTDRKNNEYVSKIKAMEEKMKGFAPYEQYMPELAKVLAEKQKQEQANQYQQNPLQYQQQIMEQMLNERLAPFQQQQAQQQNEQVVDQSINYMKTTYGEEAFAEASPIMSSILNNTKEQFGPEAADMLAKSPEHLFTTAFGYMALNKIREFNSNKAAGTQNKTQLAQQSAGISRPNKTSRVENNQSKSQVEQAAFDFLKQNS